MEPKQIIIFKHKLEKLRQGFGDIQDIENQSTSVVELDQTSVGRLSRMDALQSQAMAKETSRRNQQQLKKIIAALKRITEGEHAYCLACDEEIDIRRLQYNPAVEYCIPCAEAQEGT